MKHVFEKYQIDSDLSCDEQLALLEKAKQKLLRKLNHVFGDPEKEQELNVEMDQLELAMDWLRAGGGSLSLDDVNLETRSLSQTMVSQGQKEEQEIAEKERMLMEEDLTYSQKYSFTLDRVIYYLRNHILDSYGYWCQYGAQLGLGYFMNLMYQYHTMEMFGCVDPQKAFYWLKKAAEAGEKDCCYELGKYYIKKNSPMFDLKTASIWFAKAADEEHPDAYLYAFTAFQMMRDYERAEICLKAAYDMGVPGAAYRMAIIYDVADNKTGERQIDIAKDWYEKAYHEKPDGNICHGLGNIYLEVGETELGIQLLIQGHRDFGSEECLESLQELIAE